MSCWDVMTRLESRGHHVEVLCSSQRLPRVDDPGTKHERRVHRTLQLYYRDRDLWAPAPPRRLAIERANQRALAEALDLSQPDVVSIWQVGAMSLGLITSLIERRLPLVYAVCDLWPTYAVKLDAWLRLFARWPRLGRFTHRMTGVPSTLPELDASGAFCFNSELMRQQARRASPWHFPVSGVVFSGIERRVFSGPSAERPSERPWQDRLVFVGRLDPRKGVETLLRSLRRLPEGTLVLHGPGSDAELTRWNGLAKELGVAHRVSFGCSDRADLPAVYAAADVCVFPSEWDEPFGLVPLEAMACGVPVVATGAGGSAEFLVDGENCLLFPAGDAAALATAVERLADDPSLRARLVSAGFETAEYFDVERLTDAFEAWYEAALAGFPDGPLPDRQPPLRASGGVG
ncbi:MAG: glycosyltransferase family 4 protein [Acidimicrobiales bacterium]